MGLLEERTASTDSSGGQDGDLRPDHDADVTAPLPGISPRMRDRRSFFDALAPKRDRFKARRWYYYEYLGAFMRFVVPPGQRVLELGCGTGDLLATVKPAFGVGMDISLAMLEIARGKYPYLHFVQADAHCLALTGTLDYIILSDLVGDLDDVQEAFTCLRALAGPKPV